MSKEKEKWINNLLFRRVFSSKMWWIVWKLIIDKFSLFIVILANLWILIITIVRSSVLKIRLYYIFINRFSLADLRSIINMMCIYIIQSTTVIQVNLLLYIRRLLNWDSWFLIIIVNLWIWAWRLIATWFHFIIERRLLSLIAYLWLENHKLFKIVSRKLNQIFDHISYYITLLIFLKYL